MKWKTTSCEQYGCTVVSICVIAQIITSVWNKRARREMKTKNKWSYSVHGKCDRLFGGKYTPYLTKHIVCHCKSHKNLSYLYLHFVYLSHRQRKTSENSNNRHFLWCIPYWNFKISGGVDVVMRNNSFLYLMLLHETNHLILFFVFLPFALWKKVNCKRIVSMLQSDRRKKWSFVF